MKYGDTKTSIKILTSRFLSDNGLDADNISDVEYVIKSTCDGSALVTKTLSDGIIQDPGDKSILLINLSQTDYDELEPSTRYLNIIRIKMSGDTEWFYPGWPDSEYRYITFSANCFL